MTAANAKYTPGPYRFVQQDSWPYSLSIYGGSPEHALISAPMPAHSSADKSADDAINAVNFDKIDRAHAARMNAEMIATFRLWASAPDLVEACQRALAMLESAEGKALVGDEGCLWGVELLRAALAKAGV